MCFIARRRAARVHALSSRAPRAAREHALSPRAPRDAANGRDGAAPSLRPALPRAPPPRAARSGSSTMRTRTKPPKKKNPAAAALIGRCPSTAALSLIVKVGKMFVCIETVGRVARRAMAAAGSVASRVRAMVLRIFYSVSLRCPMPPIHVGRLPKITGTRVDAWLRRCYRA